MRLSAASLAVALLFVAPAHAWRSDLPATPPDSRPFAIAADAAGDVVVAGRAAAENGEHIGLVAKLDGRTGEERWRHTIAGDAEGDDVLQDVQITPAGDVVVVGFLINSATGDDAYVAKLAGADGSVVWDEIIDGGANDDDDAFAAVLTAAGDVVVAGSMTVPGSGSRITVWKLAAADGATLWDEQISGGSGTGRRVVLTAEEDVIVAGEASDDAVVARLPAAGGAALWRTQFAGAGAADDLARALVLVGDHVVLAARLGGLSTGTDIAIIGLTADDGGEAWRFVVDGTAEGMDDADDVHDLAVAPNGDVLVAGEVFNADGGGDLLVLALEGATGIDRWRREIDGPAGTDDEARAVAVGAEGDAIVAGSLRTPGVGADIAVLRLAGSNGAEQWRRLTNGADDRADVAFAVALDAAGHAVVGGRTRNGEAVDELTVLKLAGASGGDFPCGDGTVDTGEECDDANPAVGDGCRLDCSAEICGDGMSDPGEGCDDGNTAAGDCCSPVCTVDADGTACSDGDVCTIGDRCEDGVCERGDGCEDDHDPCTEDVCDDELGCQWIPLTGFDAVSCVLASEVVESTCTDDLPRKITRPLERASERLGMAEAEAVGSGRKARRLLGQARKAARRALRLASRRGAHGDVCAQAVADNLVIFVERIDDLRATLVAG
jgi:cysteine-rich repeat protein